MPEPTIAPPPQTVEAPQPISHDPGFVHQPLREAFSKIDDLAKPNKPDVIPQKKEAPKEPPKEIAKEPAKEPSKEPDKEPSKKPEAPKEEATKPEDAKPTDAKPAKPTAWEWGRQQERLAKDYKNKFEALEKEVQQLKSNPAKPSEDPERIEMAKRLAELEDKIKFADYEQSSEFQDKYHRPFLEAYENAKSSFLEMSVLDQKTGEPRQATDQDFSAIVSASTAERALEIATALFGDNHAKAAYALQQRENVRLANNRAEAAKKEFRTKGLEREKEMATQREMAKKAARDEFQRHNEEALKKLPEYFAEREGDEEWNSRLKKGFERVDAAFEGKGNPALNSSIRMKAGSWDALHYEVKNLKSELKDALAKIKEYEGSEPTTGSPEKETAPPKPETAYDKIERLANRIGR